MIVDKEKNVLFEHKMGTGYLHAVRRTRNGHFVGIGSGGEIYHHDAQGKLVREVKVMHEGTWGDVDILPDGNYLVANYGSGFIRSVNHKGGTVWEAKVDGACGVEQLPSGQFLIGSSKSSMMVDRNGKVLWEVKSEGFVRRSHRR
jgi:hypothetical protein